MIAFFIIAYCVFIWLVYYQLKIKPTPFNLAVCATIGIVAVGTIVICWRFASPTSNNVVVMKYTIPIVPQIRGHIKRLVAKPNMPLKKDKDVLFVIDQEPFEISVRQKEADLEVARRKVQEIQASIPVGEASIREAESNRDSSKAELDAKKATNERSPGAVSEVEIEQLQAEVDANLAAIDKAKASLAQTKQSLRVSQEQVVSANSQLDSAQYDLAQCTVYAPSDGFITQWVAREGTMASPLPVSPVGTFVESDQVALVAIFSQNVLSNVRAGDQVEVAMKSLPGQVLQGTVDTIIEATGEGQVNPSGQLVSAANFKSSGLLAVKLKLDDSKIAEQLPIGAAGNVAVYTESGKPFQIISKVYVRMQATLYYLIPF